MRARVARYGRFQDISSTSDRNSAIKATFFASVDGDGGWEDERQLCANYLHSRIWRSATFQNGRSAHLAASLALRLLLPASASGTSRTTATTKKAHLGCIGGISGTALSLLSSCPTHYGLKLRILMNLPQVVALRGPLNASYMPGGVFVVFGTAGVSSSARAPSRELTRDLWSHGFDSYMQHGRPLHSPGLIGRY